MKILDIEKINDLNIKESIITIGFFDGVHIGHQKIFNEMKNISKKENKTSIVITFDESLINKFKMSLTLCSTYEKIKCFEAYDFDYVLLFNENSEMLNYSALDFINKILNKLNCKTIVCGSDFNFGHDRLGNVNYIKKNSDFNVVEIDDVIINNTKISSTYIRGLIGDGKIDEANNYLFEPFNITSKVIHGKQIGRTIDYKTANLLITNQCKVLKQGVYYGYIVYNQNKYKAMINVGFNPTVSNENSLHIEAYILDFDMDIYDEEITVFFLHYAREEKKFNNKDELHDQLNKDYKNLVIFKI